MLHKAKVMLLNMSSLGYRQAGGGCPISQARMSRT